MACDPEGGSLLTADEFLLHPAANERTELVRGAIRVMTPASPAHGLVSMTVGYLLSARVRKHRLGACFGDSTGYALPNLADTVRAPDASFVRTDRLPPEGVGGSGFAKFAPDLAVEVLSPSESTADLAGKLADYRVAATPMVWVIDPVSRTVAVITNQATTTLGVGDILTAGDVVPGFAGAVAELFEGLAPPLPAAPVTRSPSTRRPVWNTGAPGHHAPLPTCPHRNTRAG